MRNTFSYEQGQWIAKNALLLQAILDTMVSRVARIHDNFIIPTVNVLANLRKLTSLTIEGHSIEVYNSRRPLDHLTLYDY